MGRGDIQDGRVGGAPATRREKQDDRPDEAIVMASECARVYRTAVR